tara:strand:+ start:2520 stop:3608 length:1089 start_codon:yes stop_codon:yes gene_type:complete
MPILKDVLSLRRVSFYLFLIPSIALVGSILILNTIVSFKYQTSTYYPDKIEFLGKEVIHECNEENNFCHIYEPIQGKKLGDCNKFIQHRKYIVGDTFETFNQAIIFEGGAFADDGESRKIKEFYNGKNIKYQRVAVNLKKTTCIKNSNFYFLYKVFPYAFDFIDLIKNNKNSHIASSYPINPLIYGEVSISNVVKKFPLSYFFKPLMYVSVILMIGYWILYRRIFNKILSENKLKSFFIFGILSAIFLFFHVTFLGSEIESEIFHKIRRLIIVLFILCELLAQAFLVKVIYSNKQSIYNYVFKKVVFAKIFFVLFVLFCTLILLIILIFFNLPSQIDYILEWNYFLFLLIFYLMSSIMWKKN